jgi:tetratricopeptide (TPR) repeat protein
MNALHRLVHALNEEAAVADVAVNALLTTSAEQREQLLAQNPGWLRIGVLEGVLDAVRIETDRNQELAFELATFVVTHMAHVASPEGSTLLLDLFLGSAWRDYGTTCYRREKFDDALDAANRAVTYFLRHDALLVDRGTALMLKAQAMHELGHTTGALDLLSECEAIFAEHGEAHRYIQSLEQRGNCLFDLAEKNPTLLDDAEAEWREAEKQAIAINDRREVARIANAFGHAALRRDALADAQRQFARAFLGFSSNAMDGELQRAIWGIADIAAARGQFDAARTMFRNLVRQFWMRGMVSAAASVLSELIQLLIASQSLADVREECLQLITEAANDAVGNVAEALAYLHHVIMTAEDAETIRDNVLYMRDFVRHAGDEPAAVFMPPPVG